MQPWLEYDMGEVPQQPASQKLETLYADRRGEVRFVTVYRLVKVHHDGDEGLGRCRNISDGGAKLDLNMELAVGDHLTVAFSSVDTVDGTVVWRRRHEYGIVFDEAIDCMSVLGHLGEPFGSAQVRPPRLNTNLPARVAYDGGTVRGTVSDISVRGMKIAGNHSFEPGLRVRVILEGGREREGVVRWSRDNTAGVMLLEPFAVEDLGSARRLELSYGPDEPRSA